MKSKSLDFLGFPYYKVDNLGNIYRFEFHRSNLSIDAPDLIKKWYNTTNCTQKDLSVIFNTSIDTIKRVLKVKSFWKK